jgi:hypothetical protein
MSAVLNFNQHLQTETCPICGIVFAVPAYFRATRQQDKKHFYCPNGHSQSYTESEADRLRQQLEQQRKSTEWQKSRAQSLERSLVAQKGQVTKLKNRIARGVCPCCKRSFSDLHRHMTSKHPDFASAEKE